MAEAEIRANVEQPRVVWLSSPEYATFESSRLLQDQIQDIVEHVYVSKDVDDCEYFIRGKHGHPQYEQIFLIATIDYIHLILQRDIHDIRVLQAIFVLHPNGIESSFSSRQYTKIEGIYSDSNDLLIQLSKSVDNFSTDFGVLMSNLNGCYEERTTNIVDNIADYSELWYPLFIDLLFDLPRPSGDIRQQDVIHFANQCRHFYAHNKVMLAQIDDFLSIPNGYSSNDAVQYYTRDIFFHRRVNKALRQQNFLAVLDFRFFLLDMNAQLQKAYLEFAGFYCIGDKMTFYRGQGMAEKEMNALEKKRQDGSLITINSYMSTSISLEVARRFMRSSSSGELLPVFFQISAEFRDPGVVRRQPFAYVGHLSQYRSEELEVLFSVGSFFRVEKIHFDKNEKIHFVHISFVYEEDRFSIIDDYKALVTSQIEEKIMKTGDLLSNRLKSNSTRANIFYQHFLSDGYSAIIKAACHTGLGWLAFKTKQFDSAIAYQEQALKMYETFNIGDYLNYLYVTSYNCIGAVYRQQKQYSKALSYYLKAYEIDSTIIPIDKYAVYNSFNNVASVNIACIYKIQGNVQLAWSTYKNIQASEMKKSIPFHGPTYLKIAEAGFSECISLNNKDEQMKCIDNWKRFLDLSLTEISSSYRRSVVSGVLSIGLRFANNEQIRDKVIEYYKQIIRISQKYVNRCSDDYGIVIQCYQHIAELYRKKSDFVMSIKNALDGLRLCRVDDLESTAIFYESLAETYEQQLQQLNCDMTPEDINSKISLGRTDSTSQITCLSFERNEFSFGQYKKTFNPNLSKESNRKCRLAYCLLKVAALRQDQGKSANIRELLSRAQTLFPDDDQIQLICNNNLSYLDEKFDQIISIYERNLEERRNQSQTLCIGEDAFCYIAHLYKMKNDADAEHDWYKKGITYFEEHQFVCEHTQSSFVEMSLFHQTKNDLPSCVAIYLKLVHHLLAYREETCQLHREIVNIIQYILQQLNTDNEEQVRILKHLVQLVLKKSDDLNPIDAEFRMIIDRYQKKNKHPWIATHAYESYFDHILKHITHSLTPFVQTIIPIFRQAITAYKLFDDPKGAFDVYQSLIDTILKHAKDRNHIISSFESIGRDLEVKQQTKAVLDLYEALHQFTIVHPAQISFQDNDLTLYILDRHQQLADRDREYAARIYRRMIRMLHSFEKQVHPALELKQYLERLEQYHMGLALADPFSALDSYYNLLDIFLSSCSEKFDKLLAKVVSAMKDRPAELLELLTKYKFDYIQLIREVHRRSLHPNDRSIMCEPFPQIQSSYVNKIVSSFANKAKRCLHASKSEKIIIECWTKCLYFLLEDCSKYDEYLASCYIQLNDPTRAADVFDFTLYCNLALQYCPNACRRYLKFVYPQTQMQNELKLQFADHFYLVDGQMEIRPLEPINY